MVFSIRKARRLGSNNVQALSVEEFTDEVMEKWKRGDEIIGAGMAEGIVERWEESMGSVFREKVG